MRLGKWLCFLCLLLLVKPGTIFASDVDNRIAVLQQKITDLQGQEKTLSTQIDLIDSQITLTTLRIDASKNAIIKLSTEIDELANEITRIEGLLTKRSELVLRRIPESYIRKSTPTFGAIFLSQNFSDMLNRVKYLSRVQEEDVQLLFQLKATQGHFNERKNLREEKKIQQEVLQQELQKQSEELAVQKKTKQTLLAQTQSDEAIYQQLLAQALAEKNAIDRALVEGVAVGPVKKGDPIALVGNSGFPGCSTGAHLHFEVRQNNAWMNPEQYLSSKNINDDQNGGNRSTGGGNWDWPLSDPIKITQWFGHTPWSWRYSYSGGIHTGFDMVSGSSTVIRAPSDGTLYSSSQLCGGSSIIKIKYIDHGGGLLSFYLHVQ